MPDLGLPVYTSKVPGAPCSWTSKHLILKLEAALPKTPKSATRRPANRFYHSAKISEYQFKRVLYSFVQDEPIGEAARHIALSANSIAAIHVKIRHYFTELGVFRDIYAGGNPVDGTPMGDDWEGFELRLLGFHLERLKRKRRIRDTSLDAIDYQWCESFWRFHYSILTDGRPSEVIYRMMFSHLLAHIRLSGPVGLPPIDRAASAQLDRHHFKVRIQWLERNAPAFRDKGTRDALRQFRERD